MAANLQLSQPGGAGDGAVNGDLSDVWAGVPLFAEATTAYASYAWTIVAWPTGAGAVIEYEDTDTATITFPVVKGEYQIRLAEPAGSRTVTVRVTRDSDGEPLARTDAMAPSLGAKRLMSPSLVKGAQRLFELSFSSIDQALEDLWTALGSVVGGGITEVTSSAPITVTDGTTAPALSIADGAIALAKIVNVTAARVLGSLAGGAPSEIPISGTSPTGVLGVDASGDAALRRLTAERVLHATALELLAPTVTVTAATEHQIDTALLDINASTTTIDGTHMTLTLSGSFSANATGNWVGNGASNSVLGSFTGGVEAKPGNGIFAVGEYLAVAQRIRLRWFAAVAIVTATTSTVGTFIATAQASTLEIEVTSQRTTSPTAATTAKWKVRRSHILEGGVATPIGDDIVELISGSADGCTLAWDVSTTSSRLRLVTPDTTPRTARAGGMEII